MKGVWATTKKFWTPKNWIKIFFRLFNFLSFRQSCLICAHLRRLHFPETKWRNVKFKWAKVCLLILLNEILMYLKWLFISAKILCCSSFDSLHLHESGMFSFRCKSFQNQRTINYVYWASNASWIHCLLVFMRSHCH